VDATHARRLVGAARILGARSVDEVRRVIEASPVGQRLGASGVRAITEAAEAWYEERFCER
jgi:hypothetical protein